VHTSKIEWVLNPDNKTLGKIWNPITGCLNGCEYCYAHRLANGRLKQTYLANKNIANVIQNSTSEVMKGLADPFYPRFWPERLLEPTDNQRPRGIFVCDMSDLFGIDIPTEWTELVMLQIKRCPQHRFYLLTKQSQNLIKWSPFPDNVYLGVSATNPTMFYSAVYYLKDVQSKVKYISFEPLLQSLRTDRQWKERLLYWLKTAGIDWVIIGGQTNPTVYPKIEWVNEIIEAADKVSIPVFQKDNLKPLLGDNLRQELPE